MRIQIISSKPGLSWQWCRWEKATEDSLYWSWPLLVEAELSHRNEAIMSPRPCEATTFDPPEQHSKHPDSDCSCAAEPKTQRLKTSFSSSRTAQLNVKCWNLVGLWPSRWQILWKFSKTFTASYKESDKKDEFSFYWDKSTAFWCKEERHLYSSSSSRQKTVLCTVQDTLHIYRMRKQKVRYRVTTFDENHINYISGRFLF